MTDWSKLLSKAEVSRAIRERKKSYKEKKIWRKVLEEEKGEGWEFSRDDKKKPDKIWVAKEKPADEQFENRLWVLFAQMGFTQLNRDRQFNISYSSQGSDHSKQIDVFAVDDETVLVIECKCAESPKDGKFKKDIEAINGYMKGVSKEIIKKFPNHNIKFIFATQNYIVGNSDKDLMKQFGIAHFDEKVIKYYEELVKHLGNCSRYQLLGSIFANQEIEGMDNRIPAIQGNMGGYTYYSFSIQPEVLLKIGYVLHRSEANEDMMPTYQRIIKKARLKSVHDFIQNKGFFPNSLLISIDAAKPLQFDLADKQVDKGLVKLGILHLPNRYRTAYIIDGQHRLYGYSDSDHAKTNSIPVVAFENLEKAKQVKLFMEINENQKAVSKNLRNTLNADLLWLSDKPHEKREAIRSRLAQELGDNLASPLKDRVIIGEDQADDFRCITMEIICGAIKDTSFLSKYKKDGTQQKPGYFDFDNNEKTIKCLQKYIFGCFNYIKELLPEEWEKNPKQDGIILFNNGVGGFIRLFDDIAQKLIDNGNDKTNMEDFLKEAQYYLDPLKDFFHGLSAEAKLDLRASYGTNGPRDYWRNLEKAVNGVRSDFIPPGFEKYWEDHDKSHIDDSIRIMTSVEENARSFVIEKLRANNSNWIKEIPQKVFTNASQEQSKLKYKEGKDREVWEFFTMMDLSEIIQYGNNWSTLFEKVFTRPSEAKKTGGKKAKTEWMRTVDRLQKNAARANFHITKEERDMLVEVDGMLPFRDKSNT